MMRCYVMHKSLSIHIYLTRTHECILLRSCSTMSHFTFCPFSLLLSSTFILAIEPTPKLFFLAWTWQMLQVVTIKILFTIFYPLFVFQRICENKRARFHFCLWQEWLNIGRLSLLLLHIFTASQSARLCSLSLVIFSSKSSHIFFTRRPSKSFTLGEKRVSSMVVLAALAIRAFLHDCYYKLQIYPSSKLLHGMWI